MEILIQKVHTFMENLWTYFYEYLILGAAFVLSKYLGVPAMLTEVLLWVIIADMLTGVLKSVVLPTLRFSPKKLLAGLLSKFSVLIIPAVLVTFFKFVMGIDATMMIDLVMRLMIALELLSITYNAMSIYRKEEMKSKDYISEVYQFVIKVLRGGIVKLMDGLDELNKENTPPDDEK